MRTSAIDRLTFATKATAATVATHGGSTFHTNMFSVVNTAFDRNLMNGPATINNRAPDIAPGVSGPYNGGNQGWLGRLTVGDKEIKHFGDWNAHVGYKYLESDATLDAFADSDFGLGGTNLKGYFLGANYGLADNVWTTFRWMSANNIAGVPYAVDVLQVDLNAKF